MDPAELGWHTHHVVDDLARRLPGLDVAEIRLYLEHDEVGLAVDELVGVLIAERVPLTQEEIRQVGGVLTAIRDARGSAHSTGRDVDAVLAVLDREGRPLARRGMPPQRGGHLPGAARAGATQFPPGWNGERVHDVVRRMAGTPTTLANARSWLDGTVDDIRIGVLRDGTGAVRTAAPLPGPGVRRAPSPRGEVTTLLVGELKRTATALLADAAPLLAQDERTALKALRDSGEWAELADALIARLVDVPDLPEPLATAAERLLLAFDLPVDGCIHLNDRDRLVTRLHRR